MDFGFTIVDEQNLEIVSYLEEMTFSTNFSIKRWGRKWTEKLIGVAEIPNKGEIFFQTIFSILGSPPYLNQASLAFDRIENGQVKLSELICQSMFV